MSIADWQIRPTSNRPMIKNMVKFKKNVPTFSPNPREILEKRRDVFCLSSATPSHHFPVVLFGVKSLPVSLYAPGIHCKLFSTSLRKNLVPGVMYIYISL